MSGKKFVPIPATRRNGTGQSLRIVGAQENNLKNLTIDIPLGKFVCVTGVSLATSTLTVDILYNALARQLMGAHTNAGKHESIEGVEHLDKVINIDQSPIDAHRDLTPLPIRACLRHDPRSRSPACQTRNCADTIKGVFRSTSRVVAAKSPWEGQLRSKCSSCRMFTFRARSAEAAGITTKRCRCVSGQKHRGRPEHDRGQRAGV